MKTLKDSCPAYDLKPHSITFTDDDLRRLDAIVEAGDLRNRSAAVRACIQFVYYHHNLNLKNG
jgi:Arc/MetJ-type ribon-helix-helix transcriptional regulator